MHIINGNTELIAHIGFPTHAFKAPMIYNPYFEQAGINTVVVPMGCVAHDYPVFLRSIFSLSNIRGALITMPHKITTAGLVDTLSPAAAIAGACNAVKKTVDGHLIGDMFDGEGFVRGVKRKGLTLQGASALVIGCGGVGSAIAASLAAAGVARLQVADVHAGSADALCNRLTHHYPNLNAVSGNNDPSGFDLVVNATPLGMNDSDALPLDITRLSPTTFVGEVVMKSEMTPLLKAAATMGCRYQVGTDMLFEQIPAYLEFFGFPTTTPEHLRAVSRLSYT
jgi:shikimate dehydrogenase